jgi:hypothetical protein
VKAREGSCSGRLRLALCTAVVASELAAPSLALADEAPSIWYRNSERCPDGPAFIARLHGAAQGARLATAGDRIDFVVTLGDKDGRAFGRLERQTNEGRVAIRELDAPRCDEVADAIALTLTLTLAPPNTSSPAAAPSSAPTPTEPAADAKRAPEPTNAAGDTGAAAAAGASAPTPAPGSPPPVHHAEPQSSLFAGADATLYKGSLPDPLPGARLFVELRTDALLRGASARLSGFVTKRVRQSDPDVDLLLAGGRLDVSPVRFFGPLVELVPSLSLELGWERARGTQSTGVSDTAFWAAGGVSARGVVHATGALSVEAELGPSFPFTRYELVEKQTGAVIHHTESVGLSAAVGLAFRLP